MLTFPFAVDLPFVNFVLTPWLSTHMEKNFKHERKHVKELLHLNLIKGE